MKRLLLALALALALAPAASAVTKVSCNAVEVVGECTAYPTGQYSKISMTVFAVNSSTHAVDPAATSTSEVVIEFQECDACPWIRFPKIGDAPITNIDGNGRAFRLPSKTFKVRWNVLTWGAGAITGVVTYDD